MKQENDLFRSRMEERFNALEKSIEQERAGWKREIRKARVPGFGLFAGFGVDDRGEVEVVVGAGFVWKLW